MLDQLIMRQNSVMMEFVSIICCPGMNVIFYYGGILEDCRYFLVRAGESEYESLGIINTNPVAKTSVDSGLSKEGKKQTVKAALALKSMRACEGNCWVWPSITQRAYQAAEIIAAVNGVCRRYPTFTI